MPMAFFLAVSNALTRTSGWCWAVFCFILMFSRSKKSAFFPWMSLGIIALSIGYLLLVNRLVYHVESGIWLYAIVLAIPFLDGAVFNKVSLFSKMYKILWVGFIIGTIAFEAIGISNQAYLKKEMTLIGSIKVPQKWKDFLAYADENPDKVFILSFERYKELGESRNPPYQSITPGSFNNVFSLGYWNIHLPAMKAELAKRGVGNPVHDIVHDNVYLMEDNNGLSLELFYKEHYHQSLKVDTVKVFDDLILKKYSLLKDSGDMSYE
jgi:hypothetical protein